MGYHWENFQPGPSHNTKLHAPLSFFGKVLEFFGILRKFAILILINTGFSLIK